jgi:purine-binding chemotaxis protein CheW
MPDKPSGLDQLSVSDQAIYDYLDDMFREPDQAQESESAARESFTSEITSNQLLSAHASPLLHVVPQHFAEPARLHINPNIMTLQAFRERPSQSLIPSPIMVPMPANEHLLPDEELLEPEIEPEIEPKIELKVKSDAVVETIVEVETTVEQSVKPVVKPVVKVAADVVVNSAIPPIAEVVVEAVETVAESIVKIDKSPVALSDIESSAQDVAVHLPPMDEGWSENGRPEWAQARFECLVFSVGGLKLAVPLVTLGAIHQIDKKLNALPGQGDWFIGILRTSTENLKVIDTALCVMPERYKQEDREGLKFVISLHGYEWGLSCHEVSSSITLEPEEVRWRTQRGKRPWLAGTVVEHMCALIDPSGFHRVIERAEKPKQ